MVFPEPAVDIIPFRAMAQYKHKLPLRIDTLIVIVVKLRRGNAIPSENCVPLEGAALRESRRHKILSQLELVTIGDNSLLTRSFRIFKREHCDSISLA